VKESVGLEPMPAHEELFSEEERGGDTVHPEQDAPEQEVHKVQL
jgi:hypothetical protein